MEELEKIDILSLTKEELTGQITAMGEKAFRAKQIYDWLHVKKVSDFSQMSDISAQFREELSRKFCLKHLIIKKKLVSALDNTVKYLYGLPDGEAVETVLMEYKHGNSICISTQVGCKMGCKFCASTKAGFVRNLEPSEMLLQIYESERDSGRKINHVVLMGIGEPLDNFDNVVKFLRLLSAKDDMSLRHVSVSTCGLVNRIYELADLKLGITLSVSLHAPTNELRSSIMPINDRFRIEELMEACKYYFNTTGRRISYEFALIDGVNDNRQSADALLKLLKGQNCHVNLIPVNEIKEGVFKRSASVEKYKQMLIDGGLNATVRRTLGADISAACGQLRRDNK